MTSIALNLSGSARIARPKLHLTGRGRFVVAALIAVPLAIAAVFGVLGSASAIADELEQSTSTEFTYVSVHAGESLWSIATDVAPDADPRDVIADIATLNNLASSELMPGQRLAIPLAYSE